jgi:hypothetical protein
MENAEDRDMPKRKPGSLAASNNFLEVAHNFLDLNGSQK